MSVCICLVSDFRTESSCEGPFCSALLIRDDSLAVSSTNVHGIYLNTQLRPICTLV